MNIKISVLIIGILLTGNIIGYIQIFSKLDKTPAKNYVIDSTHINYQKLALLINKLDSINNHLTNLANKTAKLKKFYDVLGMRESKNNYASCNDYGYIGRYQFGSEALVRTGVCNNIKNADTFRKEFIKLSDSLRLIYWPKYEQDIAMDNLVLFNEKVLKEYIKYYDGKTINNIKITKSGILAAAHLAGPYGVKKYFKKGFNPSDDYGTKISDYLNLFSDYNM